MELKLKSSNYFKQEETLAAGRGERPCYHWGKVKGGSVCRLPGFPEREAKGSHVWTKSEVQGEPGAPWSPRRPLLQHLLELEGPRILGGGKGGSHVDGRGTWLAQGLSRAWLLWEAKAKLGKRGLGMEGMAERS